VFGCLERFDIIQKWKKYSEIVMPLEPWEDEKINLINPGLKHCLTFEMTNK
jgi:hypothetical protein